MYDINVFTKEIRPFVEFFWNCADNVISSLAYWLSTLHLLLHMVRLVLKKFNEEYELLKVFKMPIYVLIINSYENMQTLNYYTLP